MEDYLVDLFFPVVGILVLGLESVLGQLVAQVFLEMLKIKKEDLKIQNLLKRKAKLQQYLQVLSLDLESVLQLVDYLEWALREIKMHLHQHLHQLLLKRKVCLEWEPQKGKLKKKHHLKNCLCFHRNHNNQRKMIQNKSRKNKEAKLILKVRIQVRACRRKLSKLLKTFLVDSAHSDRNKHGNLPRIKKHLHLPYSQV